MRFIVMVMAKKEMSKAPKLEDIAAMQKYNEAAVKAGVLLAAEGLAPTSKGARITYGSGTPLVIDGPFAESKELVAGFSIIKVDSLQDAITWVKNAPYDFPNGEGEVEIRKLMEIEDFAEGFTPNAEVAKVKFK